MRSAASGQQTERGTSLPADVSRSVAARHQEALSSALTKLSAAAQKAISAVDVADNPAIDIDVPAALAAVADQAATVQRMLAELAPFNYPDVTPELTHELAERGHCTKGGTIASGDAYCQCGTWKASDCPDPESRRRSRKEHMDLVLRLRLENTANTANQA